jgi:predicted AAA+ superfamily ATPase
MSPDALYNIVAEWLEEPSLPPLVPRRHAGVDVRKLLRVLAVVGPRRAGKTCFLYQLIASLLETRGVTRRDILFIDFEDYRLSGFVPADMDALFAAFHALAGRDPRYLFFDEVQRLPEWGRVLRTLHNRGRYRIVVTGSNSGMLYSEVATELRGRYEDVLMLPFSFPEFLRQRGLESGGTAVHTAARGKLVAAFDQYLERGGFPEVVLAASATERRKILQNYYRTIFYRDILERHGVKARHLLEAMMAQVLETYSDVFSISKFEKVLKGQGLAGSKRTISEYLAFLREAFFLIESERFSFSARKRLMNPKKLYLIDTGFAGLGQPHSENRGKLLENLVAVELHRRGEEFFYFRDRKECDFIVKRRNRADEAIQVCWELGPRNEERELAGLLDARRVLKPPSGLILTHDQEGTRRLNGWEIRVRPAWRWLIEDVAGVVVGVGPP